MSCSISLQKTIRTSNKTLHTANLSLLAHIQNYLRIPGALSSPTAITLYTCVLYSTILGCPFTSSSIHPNGISRLTPCGGSSLINGVCLICMTCERCPRVYTSVVVLVVVGSTSYRFGVGIRDGMGWDEMGMGYLGSYCLLSVHHAAREG